MQEHWPPRLGFAPCCEWKTQRLVPFEDRRGPSPLSGNSCNSSRCASDGGSRLPRFPRCLPRDWWTPSLLPGAQLRFCAQADGKAVSPSHHESYSDVHHHSTNETVFSIVMLLSVPPSTDPGINPLLAPHTQLKQNNFIHQHTSALFVQTSLPMPTQCWYRPPTKKQPSLPNPQSSPHEGAQLLPSRIQIKGHAPNSGRGASCPPFPRRRPTGNGGHPPVPGADAAPNAADLTAHRATTPRR